MDKEHIDELIVGFLLRDIDEKSVMELAKWINSSDNNRKYFETQKDIWFSAGAIADKAEFNGERAYKRFLLAKNLRERKVRSRKKGILRYMPYAAAICILATTGIVSWNFSRQNLLSDTVSVEVPAGSKTRIYLPDSTLVWLNAESAIEYSIDFVKKERTVQLNGEAYFEVKPDKKHPFIVHSSGMDVKVLGTKFNIRNYENEDDAIFSLTEGSVRLTGMNGENRNLNPDQKVIMDKGTGKMSAYTADTTKDIKWTVGQLAFNNQPLPLIVKELERQYNVRITISDPSLNLLKFYGIFEQKNFTITEILDILSATHKFRYTKNGADFTLSKI